MGIVANTRAWIAQKLNPAQAAISSAQPISMPESIVTYETAYREIDIVHRVIEMCINALCGVPFEIKDGPQKKLDKLLNKRSNPFEDHDKMFRRAFLDFYLDGNAFFYYDNNEVGGALYVLPANQVEIVSDPKTFVKQYNYLSAGATNVYGRRASDSFVVFKPEEIIHVKTDNDQNIFRGESKLKSLSAAFATYYALTKFQKSFFNNNAIPGIVLRTENVLGQKVKERLLAEWQQNYSTVWNGSRSPAILDGGLTIDNFTKINFQELDFENSVERLQIDIAKALGVPWVLIKSGNNANLQANEVTFYTYTILPILQQFATAFAQFFNADIIPCVDDIVCFQPDLKTQSLYYSTLVNTGIITPNEAREQLGWEPMEGHDDIRVPQNVTGSATDGSQGGRPASASD